VVAGRGFHIATQDGNTSHVNAHRPARNDGEIFDWPTPGRPISSWMNCEQMATYRADLTDRPFRGSAIDSDFADSSKMADAK